MKAFVTGGSGFVGAALIRHLLDKGHSVVAIARSEKSENKIKAAAGGQHADRLRVVQGDLSSSDANRESLQSGMKGCGVVFHAAAKVEDWGPWAAFLAANVTGTEVMLEAARKAGVSKFILVGTEAACVQGWKPLVNIDESAPVNTRPHFYAPYTRSKALAEQAVLRANAPEQGFSTMSVRPRFVWGKGDTMIIGALADSVKSGAFRWITPAHKMSTCHIQNLCHALLLAAEKGKPAGVYFVTDGQDVWWKDFVTRYLATQGVKPPDKTVPMWLLWLVATLLESIPLLGYGTWFQAPICRQGLALIGQEVTVSCERARRELGYAPIVTIDQGMADMPRVGGS